MRRVTCLFFAASLLSLSALLPVGALASTTLTEYVVGAEYAVGSCSNGQTGSFAGYGSATLGGRANAAFHTTICHTAFTKERTASINAGGNFELATSSMTLVGQYASGTVGPGVVLPLYPGSRHLCKEVFPVNAVLAPATTVPGGVTNVGAGSAAVGVLTHVGVFILGGCQAFAAAITAKATLI